MLTYNDKTYDYQDLMAIGQEIASMWGGSCYDVSIDDGEIIFSCAEHGELFATTLSFDELEDYA